MRIVVVGNGATAVDTSGRCFVNRHTARFLIDLAGCGAALTFIEPKALLRTNSNLQDGELTASAVRSLPITKTRVADICRAGLALWRARLVYIFFPGTLPRAVAHLCRILGKPYALYLRGEQFAVTGRDADVFRHARFVCSVGGIGDRVRRLNDHVIPIQPMLDIGRQDALRRNLAARAPGPWNLLFVGRIEPAKGIPELVEAAEMLRARGFPFRLSLVGGGPLHGELLRRYGNDPGAPIRVHGVIDNKAALYAEYQKADLFILPTHHEGFPRVLYEAMINSTVILTTFVGGIPGVMCSGANCIEIPSKDPGAIANAIVLIAADPLRMQALADNALSTGIAVLGQHPTHLDAVVKRIHG
jgi:glycosyltransferase involved in cell wall biosynthesis